MAELGLPVTPEALSSTILSLWAADVEPMGQLQATYSLHLAE